MDSYSIVTITGTSYDGDWYIADNAVEYLTDDLGNSGTSSINLYKTLDNNHYETITIPSIGVARYRNSTSGYSSYVEFTGASVSFNAKAQFIRQKPILEIWLWIIIFVVCIVNLVRR